MKAIRICLVALMAGVAFGKAHGASTNQPSLFYNEPLTKQESAQLGAAVTPPTRVYQGLSLGRNTRLSGPVVRLFHTPRQAWQTINPFAPATETEPRAAVATPPMSSFRDFRVHEPSVALVRLSWP